MRSRGPFGVVGIPTHTLQPVTVPTAEFVRHPHVGSKVVMAVALVADTPATTVNLLLGRRLIRGLVAGSVKG